MGNKLSNCCNMRACVNSEQTLKVQMDSPEEKVPKFKNPRIFTLTQGTEDLASPKASPRDNFKVDTPVKSKVKEVENKLKPEKSNSLPFKNNFSDESDDDVSRHSSTYSFEEIVKKGQLINLNSVSSKTIMKSAVLSTKYFKWLNN